MADAERKAVVDGDGNVVNVILVDPDSDYDPGDGLELVSDTGSESRGNATVGGTWNGRSFKAPPPPEPTEAELAARARNDRLTELRAKVRDGSATQDEKDEALLLALGGDDDGG